METQEIKSISSFTKEYHYSKDAPCIICNKIVSNLGGRGKWIKILNSSNNKSIYRKIYGAGDTTLNCDQIELDYDSSKDLDIADKNNCVVKLFKATCIGQVIGHCKHPDPKYRIPLIIGIIGLVLGIISLIVTFSPICC